MKPKKSVWTVAASCKYDLTQIKDILAVFKAISYKLKFPATLECPHCGNKHTIRALDDFPNRSIICECKEYYFVTLVKVLPDGSKEILL